MKTWQEILEKTYNIGKDVNLVYNELFKKTGFEDEIKNQLYPPMTIINNAIAGRGGVRHKISSSILKSKDAQLAHKMNPVDILVGVFSSPAYIPNTKEIRLTYNPYALRVAALGQEKDVIKPEEEKRYRNEFKKSRILSTISHELSHWINDTFHNRFISKLIKYANELNSREVLKLKNADVNMTNFEIDAQVHGVKALKQNMSKKKWDTISSNELFDMYPSLHSNAIGIKKYGEDVLKIWYKLLFKRLVREKLLGKNMKGFPKI